MKKVRKIDIRLTDEQYAWLVDQANKKTISKSACFRMLLEEMRRPEIDCTAESKLPMPKDRITRGVSFKDEALLNQAKRRVEELGLTSFSEYINQLIRKDHGMANIFDSIAKPTSHNAEDPSK